MKEEAEVRSHFFFFTLSLCFNVFVLKDLVIVEVKVLYHYHVSTVLNPCACIVRMLCVYACVGQQIA